MITSELGNLLCHHMPHRPFGRLCRIFLPARPRNVPDGHRPFLMTLVSVGPHRSEPAKQKINDAMALARDILGLPDVYRIGIVPGSDTGAVEMTCGQCLVPVGLRYWHGVIWLGLAK